MRMLYEREKSEPEQNLLFTKDKEGIKRLIQTKLSTLISEDNCNCINGADIVKDNVGEKDYHIVIDSIVISEILGLQQEGEKYIAKGTLKADYKNEDGNVFLEKTRRYTADIIIEENENHEAEISKLVKFVVSSS